MELKPCPFCGETQVYVREEYRFAEYDCAYLPATYTCGCESDMCPAQPTVADTYISEEEAIEAWNTRASETPNRERIIELVEELSDLVGGGIDERA